MKTFLNLTNGLIYEGDFDGFVRIQSCHCERKDWTKVMLNIDSNFLMWLALGHPVRVVDYSARKEVPRALFQGLEWIWFVCCKSWNLPTNVSVKGQNCTLYFEQEWKKIPSKLRKKFTYFRKFLNDPKKPTILSGRTDKDGDYEFFKKLVKTKLAYGKTN